MRDCESGWSTTGVCSRAFITVAELPAEGLASCEWYQDELRTLPYPSDGRSIRSLLPLSDT